MIYLLFIFNFLLLIEFWTLIIGPRFIFFFLFSFLLRVGPNFSCYLAMIYLDPQIYFKIGS
jgi:hypothetical protein